MRILVERLANEAQRLGLKVQGAAQTHWMLGCDGRPHIFFVKSLVTSCWSCWSCWFPFKIFQACLLKFRCSDRCCEWLNRAVVCDSEWSLRPWGPQMAHKEEPSSTINHLFLGNHANFDHSFFGDWIPVCAGWLSIFVDQIHSKFHVIPLFPKYFNLHYSTTIQYITEALESRAQVVLGQEVCAVEEVRDEVRIHCHQRCFRAQWAVVTVSLGAMLRGMDTVPVPQMSEGFQHHWWLNMVQMWPQFGVSFRTHSIGNIM